MSRLHDVWLIAHPEHRSSVEQYLEENPNPALHIVWIELPALIDPWDPSKGLRGIRFHYMLWHRKAYRVAKRLHQDHGFDIIHHVSWNTISAPPTAWKLGAPFVWGPVGGGQVVPRRFYRYFGAGRVSQIVRAARVRAIPFMPSLRAAISNADMVLATNIETAGLLRQAGAGDVPYLLDAGIPVSALPTSYIEREAKPKLSVLWAGTHLETRKCLPLALEALAATKDLDIELLVAGDGPMREAWENTARKLDVHERVQFLGKVPWTTMQSLYAESDVFAFTSLCDSSGTAVIEAMAHGLPILTLDHQGVGSFMPAEAGIKVPVTFPEETVAALAKGLRLLASDPAARREMGIRAWTHARSFTWTQKAIQMNQHYAAILGNERLATPTTELTENELMVDSARM